MSRRLTEAHRVAQLRLGAGTVQRLRSIWPLLDTADLDGTFDRWLLAALPVIQAQRSTSARLAAVYLSTFKAVTVGVGPRQPAQLRETAPTAAVATSLLVTGPLSIKKALTRGVPLGRAVEVAEARSSAAGMRHVLDGGRETILSTVRADPQAAGFVRVTSGNACAFCEDLAGKTIPDDEAFPAHDGCACTGEPVYR